MSIKITRPREIAAARRNLGITQKDLAGHVGITQQYVSAIERDRGRKIANKTSRKIAKALRIDWDSVFTDVEDKPRRVAPRTGEQRTPAAAA